MNTPNPETWNLIVTILIFGGLASVLFSAALIGIGLTNPRIMLQDFPKDVQAVVPPKTDREKRQTLYWGIPLWIVLLALPTIAAITAKAAHQGFLEIFLSAFGVVFFFNLVDWLIIDWLIVCTITPKFVMLPGTEGMAGYKDYAIHFRGFLIGTALSIAIGLIVGGAVFIL